MLKLKWYKFIEIIMIIGGKMNTAILSDVKNNDINLEKCNVKKKQQIINVLKKLKDKNILVIALGEFAIKSLYSSEQLTNIDEVELLINEKDIKSVNEVMNKLGYVKDENDKNDIIFSKEDTVIKIYSTLVNNSFFNDNSLFDGENLLKDAIEIKVEGVKILIPSLENIIINLCITMSSKFSSNKLLSKHLSNLVLLVEKDEDKINWKSFLYKAKLCGIYRFSIAIFLVCNKLFNMTIPSVIDKQEKMDDKYIDLLIDSINSNSNFKSKEIETVDKGFFSRVKRGITTVFSKIENAKDKRNDENKMEELLRELGL